MTGRIALGIVGGAVLLFLVAPMFAVIPMSFDSSGLMSLVPNDPGLEQYRRFFASPDWMEALARSFQVAAGATVVATLGGVSAALGVARLPARARQVAEALLILPRVVPTIVFAVAAYRIYLEIGLVGSVAGLILAHSVLAMPFVVIFVGSALRGLDPSLTEASLSLGGGPLVTFFRIILPQIRMAVLGAALFAFNVSFDEVVVTLFISGIRSKTLPIKVWDAIQYEITPILPAISVMVILATLLLLTPLLLFGRRAMSRLS
ncbi:ABC transporter permease [Bradyrhizobium sp. NP1]|uniref:ABC transporter permease n=1 Tax=Bradyrhizobium sp. NP1 TaxID=3049772 RepID=UPI0025A4D100|nr:ABC transporter permease [Bradyrhizobium sp. NP1]WJR79245.1 ABC transporter permease [Bradyrhizobium sp. NP1]